MKDAPPTTPASAGSCTLNYYSASGGGPAAQTSTSIPAGSSLSFTLSGGGSNGIASRPGFQGYIIAECGFPLAHGYAYVSDDGFDTFADGYLAVVIQPGRQQNLPEGDP